MGLSIETITLHLANLRELLLDSRTLQKIGCMMLRRQQSRLKVVVMSSNFFPQRFPVENAVTPGNSGYQVRSADSAVPDELKKINESGCFPTFSTFLSLLHPESFVNIFLRWDNLQFTVVACNKFLSFAAILTHVSLLVFG